MSLPAILLGLVVTLAFTVEAALGFGATVITVALGSLFISTREVLPAFVPLNLLVSGYLLWRGWRYVDRRLLLREVLPAMILGMPLGIFAFRTFDESMLKLALGIFIVVVSAGELLRQSAPDKPLQSPVALGLLAIGGMVHGAFATGGPVVVYVLGRRVGHDKAVFRATLSLLWLTLNTILVVSFIHGGHLTGPTLQQSGLLMVPMVAGILIGEAVHSRVQPATFRRSVFVVLLLAGSVLLARSLWTG